MALDDVILEELAAKAQKIHLHSQTKYLKQKKSRKIGKL